MFHLKTQFYRSVPDDLEKMYLYSIHDEFSKWLVQTEENVLEYVRFMNYYNLEILQSMQEHTMYEGKILKEISDTFYKPKIDKYQKIYESIIKFKAKYKSQLVKAGKNIRTFGTRIGSAVRDEQIKH